jgi:hypothetical protein
LQWSRTRPKERRQRSELEQGPVRNSNQTGPSGFSGFRIEEDLEDYRAQDDTITSLVSTSTHNKLEKEDPTYEGIEAEERSDREGKR